MGTRADGTSWAIATPHSAATHAGATAFERGGNAIDAALAAATSLAVVYPHMCGVGGDLFALVLLADGRCMAVNSSGRAPSGSDAETLRRDSRSMPEFGPAVVTVPGAVAGWAAVHKLGARRTWGEAFEDAARFAFEGSRVAPDLAETLAWDTDRLTSDPGMASVFFPDGRTPTMDDTIRQPALGSTLTEIAGGGPDALYRGEVGSRYAEGVRGLGVPILDEDLANHRADIMPPLATRYRDLQVSVVPPNSQGFVLLEILALIERLGIDPDPNGPDAGTFGLAAQAAAADRDLHLADPESMKVHPQTLLDEAHLAGLVDEIRDRSIPSTRHAGTRGDTIALVTADGRGNAVSLIQSLYDGFGSGLLEPSTGIVAHSRGACFTLEPGHPNELAPRKRPAHTLMPVMAHRDGALEAVAGSMGGYGQPQINAATLIRSIELGQHPAEAVATPRWLASSGDLRRASVEPGVPDVARTSLGESGFELDELTGPDGAVGHAHLIRVGADGFHAGSDPRSDGAALAG